MKTHLLLYTTLMLAPLATLNAAGPVAERLKGCLASLKPEVACSGPVARTVSADGQRLRVAFVSAHSVPNPVWVRFAWNNKAEPNLINREGLPASAFRMKTHEFNKQGTPPGLSGGALHAADDMMIADFEGGGFGGWKAEGTAFGTKHSDNKVATQLGFKGFSGKGLAQSFTGRDTKPTGTLTSPEFTIERDYINMLIGGGASKHSVGVKVLVEGKEVGRVAGERSLFLDSAGISVKAYRGKKAVVVVYDQNPDWWGYIAADDIRQSNQKVGYERLEKKIIITGKCLLFPIARTGNSRNVLVEDEGGVKLHSLRACLAMTKEQIAWWGYLEVDDYIGKTVTISVEQRIGTSVLDLIECADEPRFLQPQYDEPLRPQFHFSQLTGWNNDPNGLLWADGFYHIFWQCNPLGTAWGNMYWGHAKSPDLVHWAEMKRAVRSGPGDKTPDNLRHPSMAVGACFSGGGNVDINNTAGWKTGDKDVLFLLVSDMSRGQSIAYSTDGGENFRFYEKNPVFTLNGNDGKPVWYEPGKHWVAVVFDKTKEIGENIAIWTSQNLKDWEHQSNVPGFHECPELFELPVDGDANHKKWVICGASLDCLVGTFDGRKFTPDPGEKRTLLSRDRVYAGQGFSNVPGGRVIYTAWAKVDMGDAPFNQGFSIPMELTLKTAKDGRVSLFANPVKEIESLRGAAVVTVKNAELNSAHPSMSWELSAELYDVCLTLQKKGNPREVAIAVGRTTVSYNFETGTCNGQPTPMIGDKIDIRILIDRPTAEVFSAGGYSYELMKRVDGGKNVGRITVKSDAPRGSGVVIENLTVYPMTSIWKK
jgi:fructan beta-fructosidase